MFPTKDDLIRNPNLPALFGVGYDADAEGWKADARAELQTLEQLNEDVDELSSTARGCDTLCPDARTLLDLAWWFTEDAIRETTGTCSSRCSGKKGQWCACCYHYDELKAKAHSMRRRL